MVALAATITVMVEPGFTSAPAWAAVDHHRAAHIPVLAHRARVARQRSWAQAPARLPKSAAAGSRMAPGVGGDGPIYPSSPGDELTTTAAAFDPTTPTNLFVSGNLVSAGRVVGFTQAATGFWQPVVLPQPDQQPNQGAYETAVAYDNRGELYDAYMTYQVSTANSIDTQLVVARSTDKGLDWNHPVQVDSALDGPEKPVIAVDRTRGAHANRLYIAYDAFPGTTGNPIMVSHSDNGLSWSAPTTVFDYGADFGASAVVDGQGNLLVAWSACAAATPAACSRSAPGQIVVARSTDGGNSFQPPQVVSGTATGVDGTTIANYGPLGGCNGSPPTVQSTPTIEVDRSGGPHNGTVYLAWSDLQSDGHMHVYVRSSPDGGGAWNPRMQLDGGNPNDGWQATVAVDQTTGVASASWYDRRDDPSNGVYRVYHAQSIDGGTSFGQPVAISSGYADPRSSCSGTGDGIQMAARNGNAEPFWTTGDRIFAAQVDEAALAQAALAPALSFKKTSYPVSQSAYSVATGDFNGDGKLDVVTATSAGIDVFLNDGNGSFAAPIWTTMNLSYPAIATGDFNRDGKLDVAVAAQSGLWILLGNGNGSFGAPSQVQGSVSPAGLVVADFNRDGKQDVAVTDPNRPALQVFLGNGDGTLQLEPKAFAPATPGTYSCIQAGQGPSIVAGHFTGPNLDLAVSSTCTDSGGTTNGLMSVIPGNGDGTFQGGHPAGGGGFAMPADIVVGKLARNSPYDDVAFLEGGADNLVIPFLGQGNGLFTRGTPISVGQHPTSVTIADLNGDALGDIAVANNFSNNVTMVMGNGDGSFGPSKTLDSGNYTYQIASGDFNGDGRSDVAVTSGSPNLLTVFLSSSLSMAPPSLAFGNAVIGTSSPPQTVVVTNSGSAPVRIALTEVQSNGFDKTADTCSGTSLAPLASCQVSVAFTPVTAGATGASLEIVDDATGSPHHIPLTGTGVASTRTVYQAFRPDQYQLVGSDGQTWTDMDTSGLSLWIVPSADSTAVIGGNADLWTATAGYNQDIGIEVGNGLIAWKESGGFAGTYSPNAAFVQATYSMKKDTIYQVKLVWKTNRNAPNATMVAGAGSPNRFSPTSLTVRLVPAAQAPHASISTQPSLPRGNGLDWSEIDPSLRLTLYSGTATNATLGGNADLWTARPGFNQDIGIFVSGGAFGSGQLVAWKESGGFAGTYSPNAAFVQAVIPLEAATSYSVSLKWKANKSVPANTVFSGAGPIGSNFSPTALTALLGEARVAAGTGQYAHAPSASAADWQPLSPQTSLTLAPEVADRVAILCANADLWTAVAGYNQDLGIFVSDNGGPATLIAWKESGGFAGTYSPNAAYVQSILSALAGHTYTVTLMWKANRPTVGATIYAGAGPIGDSFSPTSLTAQLTRD